MFERDDSGGTGAAAAVPPRLLSLSSQAAKTARMTDPAPVRRRRTQSERSAETREKLIQAAITCLHRTGYSATTITTVAEEAQVSRGAMTHQFPAKTDLMLAVVRAVVKEDGRLHDAAAARLGAQQWLNALPETMWGVISRPAGIAVMEIMLASRSDPDLAAQLRRLQTAIDADAQVWLDQRIRSAGLEPRPDTRAIHELCVAAVRGLALEATFMNNDEGVHRSLAVLSQLLRDLFPTDAPPKERPE